MRILKWIENVLVSMTRTEDSNRVANKDIVFFLSTDEGQSSSANTFLIRRYLSAVPEFQTHFQCIFVVRWSHAQRITIRLNFVEWVVIEHWMRVVQTAIFTQLLDVNIEIGLFSLLHAMYRCKTLKRRHKRCVFQLFFSFVKFVFLLYVALSRNPIYRSDYYVLDYVIIVVHILRIILGFYFILDYSFFIKTTFFSVEMMLFVFDCFCWKTEAAEAVAVFIAFAWSQLLSTSQHFVFLPKFDSQGHIFTCFFLLILFY